VKTWIYAIVVTMAISVARAQDLKYINPEGLAANPRYTHVIETPPATLVFVSGQVGNDSTGKIVSSDFRAQAKQVFENIKLALAAERLGPDDMISINTFMMDMPQNIAAYREVREQFFAGAKHPPTSTTVGVSALAIPGALLEVDVVARKPTQTEAKVFVTATMHAKPGMRDELRQKLFERVQHGRNEPGCVRFDLLAESGDPDTFLLNEAWVSDDALDAHFKSDAHLQWQTERDKYVASRQLMRWHAVSDSK